MNPEPKNRNLLNAFKRGLAALLPTILTLYILWWVFDFLYQLGEKVNTHVLRKVLDHVLVHDQPLGRMLNTGQGRIMMNILGVLLAVILIFLLGLVLLSFLGRRLWSYFEKHLGKLPLVRIVYPQIKKLTDFFFTEARLEFRYVCAVPYPRKGVWSLGFVTGPGLKSISKASGKQMLAVFIPSSPTPVTGYVIYVPAEEVVPLSITADQLLTITMSGGVIPPPSEVSGPDAFPPEAIGEGPEVQD